MAIYLISEYWSEGVSMERLPYFLASNKDGYTSLISASGNSHKEVVLILLTHGATS